MKQEVLDVIVIEAGFAGSSAIYHLKKYGLSHYILSVSINVHFPKCRYCLSLNIIKDLATDEHK